MDGKDLIGGINEHAFAIFKVYDPYILFIFQEE